MHLKNDYKYTLSSFHNNGMRHGKPCPAGDVGSSNMDGGLSFALISVKAFISLTHHRKLKLY